MNKFMQEVVDSRYRNLSHDWYASGMDQFQGPFNLTNEWDISDNVDVYGNPAWMNAATDYVNNITGKNSIAPWADTYQQDRIGTLNYVKNPEYNAFLGGRGNLQSSVPGYTDDSIAGYFKEAFSDPAQIKNRSDAIRNLRVWNENAGNGGVGLNKATDPMTKQYFDELRLNELYGLDGSRFNPPPPEPPQQAPPQGAPPVAGLDGSNNAISKFGTPLGGGLDSNEQLFPRDGRLPAGMDQRFLVDPTIDAYGNPMGPRTGGVRRPPTLMRPGFGGGFGGGIGNLFNQLAYMPEENFARSMDRYRRFNDQYGSSMGPRNPMNSMNMFNQFGRMDDAQFDMGMDRYQQYRDMFNPTVRPDPRPQIPPFSPGSPDDTVSLPPGMNPNKPPSIPRPVPDVFPAGFNPGSATLDGQTGAVLSDQMTTTTEYGDVRDQSGNVVRPAVPRQNPYQSNPNQAPQYFGQFGPNRNPYATGYGMGYQPSYQPPYMPQQGRLSYNQGPSKGSPGPGMSYMSSPAGQDGYGAFGGGQGYYSPSRPSAPAGASKGGTGGSSPSGKGGSA